MLYLVNCHVIEYRYLDDNKEYNRNHIVEADSKDEATAKVERYYTDKKEQGYTVFIEYVTEMIK